MLGVNDAKYSHGGDEYSNNTGFSNIVKSNSIVFADYFHQKLLVIHNCTLRGHNKYYNVVEFDLTSDKIRYEEGIICKNSDEDEDGSKKFKPCETI